MTVANAAYAAKSSTTALEPWQYNIREPLDNEIIVEVLFCGICHSDIHTARSEWSNKNQTYPIVPGHEFTGIVAKTGPKVTKHKVGDRIGVGCFVDSCKSCDRCQRSLEQYCDGMVLTYAVKGVDGNMTYGGYGRYVVCHEHCAVSIPDTLPMDRAAPLLCAGITTYSPFKHWKMDRGNLNIGVIGLGGLGHCAVMWAASIPSNNVYVFSRNESKKDLAMQLGAKGVVISTKEEEMKAQHGKLDYIIDTVSAAKEMAPYLHCLKLDGTMVMVGLPPSDTPTTLPIMPLIMRRRSIAASTIGGIAELQEMVNYAAAKNILPHIELISCNKVNEAFDRVVKGDVKFRFVMDIKNTAPTVQSS